MSKEQEEGVTRNRRDHSDRRVRPNMAATPETEITAEEDDLSKVEIDDVKVTINGLELTPAFSGFIDRAFPAIDDAADMQRLNGFLVLQMQHGQLKIDEITQQNETGDEQELEQNENSDTLTITGSNDGEDVVKMETNIPKPGMQADNEVSGRRVIQPDPNNNPQP